MPSRKALCPVAGESCGPVSRSSGASETRTNRLAIHVGAAGRAVESVERLLSDAEPALNTQMRSRREGKDGSVRFVVECDEQAGLDRLLFLIEKVPGAAVEECTSA